METGSARTPVARAPLVAAGVWLVLCVATLVAAAALEERAGERFLLDWMRILAFPAGYVAYAAVVGGTIAGKYVLGLKAGVWGWLALAWLCFLAAGYLQWFVLAPKLARALRRRAGVTAAAAPARRAVRMLAGVALAVGLGASAYVARGAAYFCPGAWAGAPVMDAAEQARALADIAARARAAQPVRLVAAEAAARRRDAVTEVWTVELDGKQRPYSVFVTFRPGQALCRPTFWFAARGRPAGR